MPSWPLGAVLLMSLGTSAPPAPRGRDGVELRWEAPPACPDQAAVRAAVERHVGRPLADIRDRTLSILATAHATDTHWSLTVSTVTPDGTQERALRYAHGCGPLADAAAVLIAMTIDPLVIGRLEPAALDLLTRTEDPTPAPPAPAPEPASVAAPPIAAPPVATPPANPPPAPPAPRRRVDVRGAARLSASLGHGDLPAAGGGLAGALALRIRRFQAELTGGGWFLRSVQLDRRNAAGASFNLWTLGLRGGAVLPIRRRLEVPLLLGVEAGQIHVRGVELVRAGDTRTPWAAVTLTTGLAIVPLPGLAVVLGVDGFVPLTRPQFVIEEVGEIWRPRAVGVRVALGIELRFPGTLSRTSP